MFSLLPGISFYFIICAWRLCLNVFSVFFLVVSPIHLLSALSCSSLSCLYFSFLFLLFFAFWILILSSSRSDSISFSGTTECLMKGLESQSPFINYFLRQAVTAEFLVIDGYLLNSFKQFSSLNFLFRNQLDLKII